MKIKVKLLQDRRLHKPGVSWTAYAGEVIEVDAGLGKRWIDKGVAQAYPQSPPKPGDKPDPDPKSPRPGSTKPTEPTETKG